MGPHRRLDVREGSTTKVRVALDDNSSRRAMGIDASSNVQLTIDLVNNDAMHDEFQVPQHSRVPQWNTQLMLHDVIGECLRRVEGVEHSTTQ